MHSAVALGMVASSCSVDLCEETKATLESTNPRVASLAERIDDGAKGGRGVWRTEGIWWKECANLRRWRRRKRRENNERLRERSYFEE